MYEDDWSLRQCWGSIFLLLYWVKTTPAVSLADISPADSLFPQSHNRPTAPHGTWNKVVQTWSQSHSKSRRGKRTCYYVYFSTSISKKTSPIPETRKHNPWHHILFHPSCCYQFIREKERVNWLGIQSHHAAASWLDDYILGWAALWAIKHGRERHRSRCVSQLFV
jgi:hypothetical protein